VEAEAVNRRARLQLTRPLGWEDTHTAPVAIALLDTSGNPSATDHTWSFSAQEEASGLYLPVVLKR
jgi:hypothetical protein